MAIQGNHLVVSKCSIPHMFKLDMAVQNVTSQNNSPCSSWNTGLVCFLIVLGVFLPTLLPPPVPTSCQIAESKTKICAQPSASWFEQGPLQPRAASYRMVPARRGLKAYNQSFMSLSLMACSRTPRCFVHTPNVLGVCNIKDNLNTESASTEADAHFLSERICSVTSPFHHVSLVISRVLLLISFYKIES